MLENRTFMIKSLINVQQLCKSNFIIIKYTEFSFINKNNACLANKNQIIAHTCYLLI